ncbi:hypothetical protein T02_13606 [Trichinella nativa]|uniref:Uncharacterized protein n=1 Tax=Trichinella nativa TaxID=6335 RepID=A0A0V1LFN6_9BILA|nr:hypothetical protein T02_13606 [Trichinella nativa]
MNAILLMFHCATWPSVFLFELTSIALWIVHNFSLLQLKVEIVDLLLLKQAVVRLFGEQNF